MTQDKQNFVTEGDLPEALLELQNKCKEPRAKLERIHNTADKVALFSFIYDFAHFPLM